MQNLLHVSSVIWKSLHTLWNKFVIFFHTYINSRLFLMGVETIERHLLRSLHTPLASFTFIHLIIHARRLRVLRIWPFWRTFPIRSMYVLLGDLLGGLGGPSVATHIYLYFFIIWNKTIYRDFIGSILLIFFYFSRHRTWPCVFHIPNTFFSQNCFTVLSALRPCLLV